MQRLFRCDPVKRDLLLNDRGFDLLDMAEVFDDRHRLDFADHRYDNGEARRVTVGRALGRIFTVVYTMRGPVTWLITAWPSNRKERERYGPH
jgi:uncharacterized DUF497 family protein